MWYVYHTIGQDLGRWTTCWPIGCGRFTTPAGSVDLGQVTVVLGPRMARYLWRPGQRGDCDCARLSVPQLSGRLDDKPAIEDVPAPECLRLSRLLAWCLGCQNLGNSTRIVMHCSHSVLTVRHMWPTTAVTEANRLHSCNQGHRQLSVSRLSRDPVAWYGWLRTQEPCHHDPNAWMCSGYWWSRQSGHSRSTVVTQSGALVGTLPVTGQRTRRTQTWHGSTAKANVDFSSETKQYVA